MDTYQRMQGNFEWYENLLETEDPFIRHALGVGSTPGS